MSTDHSTTTTLPQRAAAGLQKEIAHVWGLMKVCSGGVEEKVIELTNLARQNGMLLLEWRGHEQMRFEFWNEFYRNHAAELPDDLTQLAAERCIKVFRAKPEQITTFKEANEVLADVFIAQELLPVPARNQPGVKSPLPPLTDFTKYNMEAQGRLQKYLDHHALTELPETEVWTLMEETRYQHALHENARKRLEQLRAR